jgi:predicted permease
VVIEDNGRPQTLPNAPLVSLDSISRIVCYFPTPLSIFSYLFSSNLLSSSFSLDISCAPIYRSSSTSVITCFIMPSNKDYEVTSSGTNSQVKPQHRSSADALLISCC